MSKTVLITLSRGSLIRNILKTECFSLLAKEGCKIILLVPDGADVEQLKQFSGDIICEKLQDAPWTWLDRLFNGIYKSIGYNRHTRSNDIYGVFDFKTESSRIKYWLRKIFFQPIARINILKRMIRRLDQMAVYSKQYVKLYDKYKPDILFATSIVGDTDIEVIKEAQRRNIPIVGMPKSWDNLPKVCLRIAPDKMLVWGERSRYEAITFSGLNPETVEVVGASQFDHYYNQKDIISREEFCKEWGLDPHKKIVVFGSEGKVMKHDGEIAEMIAQAIESDSISNAQLICRPHFIYKGDDKKFANIKHSDRVVIDTKWNPDPAFRDNWDYSDKQIKRFTNLMHHADVLVTSVSTLTVDACVNKTPVINYYFDSHHNTRHEVSMRRWYEREHYYHIVENHSASIAWNKDELIDQINHYLAHPNTRKKEREFCAENVGGPTDGRSGRRMAQVIIGLLNNKTNDKVQL